MKGLHTRACLWPAMARYIFSTPGSGKRSATSFLTRHGPDQGMNDRFPIAVFEWLGTFLALAAPTALVLRMRTRPIVFRSIFLFVCSVSPVIIYQGLMVSQYFYTVIGHMSISTMVLLAVVLLEHLSGKAFFHPNEQRFFFLSVVIGSALIFPQTFGIGPLNGYVLGFGSLPLTLALIVLTIAFVKFRMHVAACAVVLSVLAFDQIGRAHV